VAPVAAQRATLDKDRGADPRPVVDRAALDIEDRHPTLEHGGVIVEGLELACTGSGTSPLAGISISASASGDIELSDNIISLEPSGTGSRVGIATDPASAVSLKVWNNVVSGIGDGGNTGHVGMLFDGSSVDVVLSANTVYGGYHGIQGAGANVLAANNLVVSSTAACFTGPFDPLSHHNLSSDSTAPGSSTIHSATVAFSQPSGGDHHLVCDPGLGWAEISTTQTNYQVEVLFDGDPFSLYVSDNINPAFVQFAFPAPQELDGIRIALSSGNHHRWMLATADTTFDMENQTGSYTVVVPWRDTYPPDPQWDQVDFGTPQTTSVARLTVDKAEGDFFVHIGEVQLLAATNEACDVAADLSTDGDLAFSDDLDGLARLAPWDIGADEGDPVEIEWSETWVDVTEEEGSIEIELELTRPSSYPVTVQVDSIDGAATVGDGDYLPVSTTVTFAPGVVQATVPVTILSDGVPESEEVFQLELSQAGAAQLGNDRWTNIRVNDARDLPAVNIQATASYSENAAWFDISVSLAFGLPEPVVVEYVITDQTAIEGSDYRGTSGSLVFSPWSTGSLISVRNINDNWFEPDETFLVEITSVSNAELGTTVTSVVTIVDDDVTVQPTVRLANTAVNVSEGAGTATLTLLLSENAGPNLSVYVSLTPQTATPAVDYVDVSGFYTFDQGSSQLTVDIPILPDSETESDETLLAQLGNPSPGLELGSPIEATLTIVDDDGPPKISFAEANPWVAEAVGTIDLLVVLDRAADEPVTVQVDTHDDTATAGSDYTAVNEILTIPIDQTSGVVTITIANDGTPEGDEVFTVALTNPVGADPGTAMTATVTITEMPVVTFAEPSYSLVEGDGFSGGGYFAIQAALSEPVDQPVAVTFTTSPRTASENIDYEHTVSTFSFAPMETTATGTIKILHDYDTEPNETIIVTLSDPVDAVIGNPTQTTITIIDNETFQAYDLQALHIEHDLVHIEWAQTEYSTSAQAGWKLYRRDADIGGDWTLLTETRIFTAKYWRDFSVASGIRYEYKVVPYYDPIHLQVTPVEGIESVWTSPVPTPSAAGEASNILFPGYGSAAANSALPVAANSFAGTHSYTFTLLPDPGPTFEAGTTIDVYIDEEPAASSPDEPSQPTTEPFYWAARDEHSCHGPAGTPIISGQLCEGPSCEIVVPDLATGAHLVRFEVTDSSGTSHRAIAQDLHPWSVPVAETTSEYEAPVVLLFSNKVATLTPVLQISGPVTPTSFDSLDCSDSVYGGQARVELDGIYWGYSSLDSAGLGYWSPSSDLEDGSSYRIGTRWYDRIVGRKILKQGATGEVWGGSQELRQDVPIELSELLTVDTSLPADQAPSVNWVTPSLVSEDNTADLWTDLWLRIEDHDQDVVASTVTVANLTYDGGVAEFPAYYADHAHQVRPEGAYGWFVARIPVVISGVELDNQLVIHVEDINGHIVDDSTFSITRYLVQPGDYPVPVISSPEPERYYGDAETIAMDASSSVVPIGYDVWLAALIDDGSDPMPAAGIAVGSSGSFVTSDLVDSYVIRAVVATPGSMPTDQVLRGRALPCLIGDPDLGCASEDVVIHKAGIRQPTAFEVAYVFPEELMLRWGGSATVDDLLLERSEDGGQSWTDLGLTPATFHYVDTNVVEGMTYHYRVRPHVSDPWSYLGSTTLEPGLPVTTPTWAAARVIPELISVEWNCPEHASLFHCDGTLELTLEPEDSGLFEPGTTIKVFLNEDTYQLTNGVGDDIPINFPDDYGRYYGRDAPACVVKNATPDVTVTIPTAEPTATITLNNVDYGANGLRFEIHEADGDFSERALLVAVHEEIRWGDTNIAYDPFNFVFFGDQLADGNTDIWGKAPTDRYSPDCNDGEMSTYIFEQTGLEAAYFQWLMVGGYGGWITAQEDGAWSRAFNLADGTVDVWQVGDTYVYRYGKIGRSITDAQGVTIEGDTSVRVAGSSSGGIPIVVDSTITDYEPHLSHVDDQVLIDSPDAVTDGVVRFRLTDADQDLDMSTIEVFNCSLEFCSPGQPGLVAYRGFYSEYQWDPTNGHFGWFLVELPLSEDNGGANELHICAQDLAGTPIGTIADPCVSTTITRISPLVFAVISDPSGDTYPTRPDDIVSVDGSASSFPAGGVAVWTFGEQLVSGFSWYALQTQAQVTDAADLVASFMTPTGYANSRKARLIVAATPDDLPTDYWPDDGELPCQRSEGEGRCDSAEFRMNSSCTVDPILATVIRDLPTGSLNVGPEEEFQLQAHVSSHAYTFAYRWTVYDADDTLLQWPITTLGYGDAGEGYSLSNNDLTITAAGQGLDSGDYLVKLDARYPDSGCTSPWYRGSPGAFTLRVRHSFDGVAPGQVVEGAPFRVYSRTWFEGEIGWVFIDEDIDNPPGELMYSGAVQPGGYVEVTPLAADLPAIGAPWLVSLGTEEDGTGRSTWINALNVITAGDAQAPNVVTIEEDSSCGGAGTECAHEILPGQTWQGAWGEAGDEDQFTFVAGAGADVTITLDRVDLTLPPQHPDAPAPEIHLAGPDSNIFAVSEPLALDATGTSLTATLSLDGRQSIIVRTSKGTGDYLVTLTIDAEGGSGQPAFGFTPERTFLTTDVHPDALLMAPVFDPFGNPITGTSVSWEQGTDCGMGTFCGNGTTTTKRSSTGGLAVLDVTPDAGGDPLWKPSASLTPLLKHRPIAREGVFERVARANAARPVLGRISMSNRALVSTSLIDPATAVELTAQARQRAAIRGDTLLKDGLNCDNHMESCPNSGELVFRAAQLALNPGDELVDVAVRVLDGGVETERLDGHTILTDIPLALEIEATVRDDQDVERQVFLTEPVGVVLSQGSGGALTDGASTCSELEITSGPAGFTYLNARDAAMNQQYTEPDGSPCCYLPTEFLEALVVIDAEVDDGQGGTTRVTKRASAVVESIPRPADACEIRPWPPGMLDGTPLVAGTGAHNLPSGASSTFDWVFSAYAIDACGNLNHLKPTDPPIIATLLSPADPEVWAEAVQGEHFWEWNVLLRSTNCLNPPCDPADDSYYVPDGSYDIQLSTPSACTGTATYDQTVDLAAERPRIRLIWEQSGLEPEPPMASPGSALRNPNTGEVIAWRVKPGDHASTNPQGETIYTDIPVRLYVAELMIWFDDDGNVVESYSKVDDAEICVGQVHWHYDPDSSPDPGWNVRTTTCDQVFTGETTVLAYTEPEWPSGYFDGYVGVAAGVTKVPDQGGRYVLMAEPLDEAFRRGDAWRIETNVRMTVGQSYSNSGTSKKEFEVGGGMFLDEAWRPFSEEIRVTVPTPIHLLTSLSPEQQLNQFELVVEQFNTTVDNTDFDLSPYSDGEYTASFLLLPPDVSDPGGFAGFTRVDVPGWWSVIAARSQTELKDGQPKYAVVERLAKVEAFGTSKIRFVDLDPDLVVSNPENFRFLIRKEGIVPLTDLPFEIPGGFESVGGVSPAQSDWMNFKARITVDGVSEFERENLDIYIWVEDPPDPSPYVASPHEGDNIKTIGGALPPKWDSVGGWSESCAGVANPCVMTSVSSASSVGPNWLIFDSWQSNLLFSGDNYVFHARVVPSGANIDSRYAIEAESGEVFVWKVKIVDVAEMMKRGFLIQSASAGDTLVTVKRPPLLTDDEVRSEIDCVVAEQNGTTTVCAEPRPQITIFDSMRRFRSTTDHPYVGSMTMNSTSPSTVTLELHSSELLSDVTPYQLNSEYLGPLGAGLVPTSHTDRWQLLDICDDIDTAFEEIYTVVDWHNIDPAERVIVPKVHIHGETVPDTDPPIPVFPLWWYSAASGAIQTFTQPDGSRATIAMVGDPGDDGDALGETTSRVSLILSPQIEAQADALPDVDEMRVLLDVAVHEFFHNISLIDYEDEPGKFKKFHCDELIEDRADISDAPGHKCIGYSSITIESLEAELPVFGLGCLIDGFPVHPGSQYAGRKNDDF